MWTSCDVFVLPSFFKGLPMQTVEATDQADCLVFATDHSEFAALTPKGLCGKRVKAIVDARNLFAREAVEFVGFVY